MLLRRIRVGKGARGAGSGEVGAKHRAVAGAQFSEKAAEVCERRGTFGVRGGRRRGSLGRDPGEGVGDRIGGCSGGSICPIVGNGLKPQQFFENDGQR